MFHKKSIFFYFNISITFQLCYMLSNQGKYDECNIIGSVYSGLSRICALDSLPVSDRWCFESE